MEIRLIKYFNKELKKSAKKPTARIVNKFIDHNTKEVGASLNDTREVFGDLNYKKEDSLRKSGDNRYEKSDDRNRFMESFNMSMIEENKASEYDTFFENDMISHLRSAKKERPG
jgi:hypothetical protein